MNPVNTQIAPFRCAGLRKSEACDADEHAHNLTNWQQQYDQISAGEFYGSIVERPLPDLQIFREHTNKALRQTCNVWPNSIWLGLPVTSPQNDGKETRINGLRVDAHTILCRPGNREFELITPEAFDIFGIVVSLPALREMARIQGLDLNWQELTRHGRLAVPAETLAGLRFLLNRLLRPQSTLAPERLQHDIVMMAVLEVLKTECPDASAPPGFARRKAIVDRVKAYLEHHSDAPVTITELCRMANTCRRTLQYSFETVMGISPLQYLRLSRLNGVRRALNWAGPSACVADIASQWGFWHLSQFSKDYRLLFGELPSDTRHRNS